MPTMTIRVSEGMKAEMETLIEDSGVWPNQSYFIREAIDAYIKRYWQGERFCQDPQLKYGKEEK